MAIFYPPIVNSYEKAFAVDSSNLSNTTFTMSYGITSTNSSVLATKVYYIQALVRKKDTNVICSLDDNGVIGIITIDDLDTTQKTITIGSSSIRDGWTAGTSYKVQLRFKIYDNAKATYLYSEWSSYCIVKCTAEPTLTALICDTYPYTLTTADDQINVDEETLEISSDFFKINVDYVNENDPSEYLSSYSIELWNSKGTTKVWDSGSLHYNRWYDSGSCSFTCSCPKELKLDNYYIVNVNIETQNYWSQSYSFTIFPSIASTTAFPFGLFTVDVFDDIKNDKSHTKVDTQDAAIKAWRESVRSLFTLSKEQEEEEGCIGLRFAEIDPSTEVSNPYQQNVLIRRTDSRSNYQTWEDLKYIILDNENPKKLDTYYDYTIESGVKYKYGICLVSTSGRRSILNYHENTAYYGERADYISRNFNSGYLLGKDQQQLKLLFNYSVSSFKYNVSDTITNTIGSTYPFVTRNGKMKYRSFQISALISKFADENNVFLSSDDWNTIRTDYTCEDDENSYYDTTAERKFRDAVINFLYDGLPKLYKSNTSGNIIVRLTDINCTPNNDLGRMLYSFSATATEIDEATIANYDKYGFWDVGTYCTEFENVGYKVGQLLLNDFGDLVTDVTSDAKSAMGEAGFFNNYNILAKIHDYASYFSKALSGTQMAVKKIKGLTIKFLNAPTKVLYDETGSYLIAHKIYLRFGSAAGGNALQPIYIFGDTYTIPESVDLDFNSALYFANDSETRTSDNPLLINAEIDYIYTYSYVTISTEPTYVKTSHNIGQLVTYAEPDTDLYAKIYHHRYFDDIYSKYVFYLTRIASLSIESTPGAVFGYREISGTYDSTTSSSTGEQQYLIVNDTGVLDLFDFDKITSFTELNYLGIYNYSTGKIDTTKGADVILDYIYYITKASYGDGVNLD